ncbi:methyltransferase-domain-containing protein [Cubamyces lactineus]|nr:methyltransferase-domain-containing protein [Cubamyces lactineus]
MSLFEVPGWSVPPAPVSQPNKKRKRPSTKGADDIDEAQMIKTAQKNIEKLMRSLGASTDALDEEDTERPPKKSRAGKDKKAKGAASEPERGRKNGREGEEDQRKPQGKEKKAAKDQDKNSRNASGRSQERTESSPAKPSTKDKRKDKQKKQKPSRSESVDAHSDTGVSHDDPAHTPAKDKKVEQKSRPKSTSSTNDTSQGLTALQANMKKSLDGARFRWINEMLYKSDSGKAHELMSSDPAVFSDYHTGFRHQVESWPTNPVSHYISTLSSYPVKTVIADLGCGDAALARALVPKGMTVLSFDLVSDGAYVIEADTCVRVPLPGSEIPLGASSADQDNEAGTGEGQIVDVVVCALSLMGTNWPGCIREAWRILKAGGEFKIAEVTSRFSSIDQFTSFITSFGFKLQSKDERNTHFTMFEFKKIPRKPKAEKEWAKLMSRGNILKPCEYKRR